MHTSFGVLALSGGRGLGEGKLIQESAMNLTNKARSLRKNQTDVEQLLWKHIRNRQLYNYKFRRHNLLSLMLPILLVLN